jgi:hypothetical protein
MELDKARLPKLPDGPGPGGVLQADLVLPQCEKAFGFLSNPAICDRPYGHTGSHSAEGIAMRGGRDSVDEERTTRVIAMRNSAAQS